MAEGKLNIPCTVAQDLWEAWKRLYRRGDLEIMASELGYSHPVINKAIKYGAVYSGELPDKINKFFTERLERERKAASDLNQLADQVDKKKGGK